MKIIITIAFLHLLIASCDVAIKAYHYRHEQWLDSVKGKKLLKHFGPNYMAALTEQIIPIMLIREEAVSRLEQIRLLLEKGFKIEN